MYIKFDIYVFIFMLCYVFIFMLLYICTNCLHRVL